MELFSNIAAGVLVNMITEASKRIWNWTKQMSQKDKTFIAEIPLKLNEDVIRKPFKKVEYEQGWYGIAFHGSEVEPQIDYMLTYFSQCVEKCDRLLENEKFSLLKYMLRKTLESRDIQTYLYNLRNYMLRNSYPFPFESLTTFGKKCGLLNDAFFDFENRNCYKKTLNW